MKTYYMIDSNIDPDTVYGPFNPICLDEAEVKRLSADWEVDLFEQMHEASREEIAKYGVYDSPAPVTIIPS